MKATLTITREELRQIIIDKFRESLIGSFDPQKVKIEVKSTQNYKAEWEPADFRAVYEGDIK